MVCGLDLTSSNIAFDKTKIREFSALEDKKHGKPNIIPNMKINEIRSSYKWNKIIYF